jgi:hypothetical protein
VRHLFWLRLPAFTSTLAGPNNADAGGNLNTILRRLVAGDDRGDSLFAVPVLFSAHRFSTDVELREFGRPRSAPGKFGVTAHEDASPSQPSQNGDTPSMDSGQHGRTVEDRCNQFTWRDRK